MEAHYWAQELSLAASFAVHYDNGAKYIPCAGCVNKVFQSSFRPPQLSKLAPLWSHSGCTSM